MRFVRSTWLVAGGVALSALLAGCSATDVNTDAGGPTTTKAKTTEGTARSNSGGILKGGLAASIASSNDPRAAAVGALVDIRLPKPEETTTTTTAVVVETTTSTAPPVVVTTPPTTPKVTLPPTTAAPVTLPPTVPTTFPAQGKPLPTQLAGAPGNLSADEQKIYNGINVTPAYVIETAATATARTHSAAMAQAGQASQIANLVDAVNAQYSQLTAIVAGAPNADQAINILKTNFGSVLTSQWIYIGIAVSKSSNGTLWITVILGNGF